MTDALLNILLVEDSPADAALVREHLRDDPAIQCRIAHVERLSDALHCLDTAHFDVVLLALSLPDSHGLETVRRLQAVSAEVPLVVLSGLHDEEIALQAVREGAETIFGLLPPLPILRIMTKSSPTQRAPSRLLPIYEARK